MDQAQKEKVLRQMAGVAGAVGEKIPLSFAGEVLDADRYWMKFRTPTGAQSDDLRALMQREQIERNVEAGGGASPRVAESRHVDDRLGPVLWKVCEFGLITDACLPDEDPETRDFTEYHWKSDAESNIAWVRERKAPMFYALISMVLDNLVYGTQEIMEDVVPEGEDSATSSDSSSSDVEASTEEQTEL